MDRSQIASEIKSISESANMNYRKLFTGLADDLLGTSGKQLDRWTGADVWQIFNPELVFSTNRQSRVATFLDNIASIFIFLPIAWTWYTLWQASSAFRKYLSVTPGSRDTFFELWQNGFGGYLPDEFWFGRYVQVSVFVIGALILTYLLKARLENRQNKRYLSNCSELNVMLAYLDQELSIERSENPKRFESILERAATELKELLKSGQELVSSIRDEVGTIQSNIAAVEEASSALQLTLDGIEKAQEAQADIFRAIYSGLEGIGREVGRIPESLGLSIGETFKDVNQSLKSTVLDFTENMRSNLNQVEKTMKTLESLQNAYLQKGDTLSRSLVQLLSDFPRVLGKLEMQGLAAQAELGMVTDRFSLDSETSKDVPLTNGVSNEAK